MKDEAQEMIWNQKQAAYVAGATERTLRTWNGLPNPPPCVPGRRGRPAAYPAQEFVAWLIEYRLGQLSGSADAGDPAAMRARLDKLRGDQVEHDLAIKRGEYAPIQALQYAVGDMAGQIKSIFEGLPKRIKNSMPSLRAREMKILERELVKAGNAIAEIEVKFDIEDEKAGGDA